MEYAFSTQVHMLSVLCVRQIIWFSCLEECVCDLASFLYREDML